MPLIAHNKKNYWKEFIKYNNIKIKYKFSLNIIDFILKFQNFLLKT
jgi:hypothetical protein